jgi:AcrR family transcriptional regulator
MKQNSVPPAVRGDVKHRLLLAAEAVFAEQGAATSVREICALAKANIAAVNYYFGSKERLYIEAVKHAHLCGMHGADFPDWPPGTPPVDRLRDFIRVMAVRMHAPASPMAMKLVMREMAHPTEAAAEVVRDHIQPIAFLLLDILRDMLPGADEERLLMIGFSVIGQLLFYRQNRLCSELIFGKEAVDRLTVGMVADHVSRFTLAALGLEPPYPSSSPPERKP